MKFNIFVFFCLGFFAAAARAERVLIVLKDKQSFLNAQASQKVQQLYPSSGVSGHTFLLNESQQFNGKIESTLEGLNAIVVNTDDKFQIAKLKADPSVSLVEKEIFHPAPRPVKGFIGSVDPAKKFQLEGVRTPWGIKAVRAEQAWSASRRGAGARVLVLDTGLDTDHPSIKNNFEKGQDFTGESQGSDVTDKIGHGTHVSGTIAGVQDNSGFTGVAPGAKILAGRVCSEAGCSNIAVAEGIDWGIQEHVDVISMSLGGAWTTEAEKKSINKAGQAGIVIVAASGNDGTNRVSYPAAYPSVIAVGAVDSDLKKAEFSQWGPELAISAPGVSILSSVPQGTGRESLVEVSIGKSTSKVASTTFQGAREVLSPETNILVNAGMGKDTDFAAINVKGKFALVKRGEIKFLEKISNAIAAGASGVVIYNNVPGLIQGALTEDGEVLPIAVFMIEQTVGDSIAQQMKAGQDVKVTLQTVTTDYSSFDGTSMATPHVAGVVALMKAANKKLNGAQVKEILKKTAQPLAGYNNNEVGAGLVNAEAAVNAAIQNP